MLNIIMVAFFLANVVATVAAILVETVAATQSSTESATVSAILSASRSRPLTYTLQSAGSMIEIAAQCWKDHVGFFKKNIFYIKNIVF